MTPAFRSYRARGLGVWLLELAHWIAEHQRFAAAVRQSWPVPLGPLGARATTLFKRNSASSLIGAYAGVLPWLRLRPVFRHRAYRHAVGSRDDEELASDAKHGLPEMQSVEAGHFDSIIITRAQRSCSAFAGRDSLANHSLGLIALGFAIAMNYQLHRGSMVVWDGESVCCARSPADGDQTSIHAVPFVKAQRPCFAISVLSLLTDQRPRVRFETGNFRNWSNHAAATVVVHSLDASPSPPVQRGGIREFATLNPESQV